MDEEEEEESKESTADSRAMSKASSFGRVISARMRKDCRYVVTAGI